MDDPSNMTCATVSVVSETGQRLRINKSDYDAMEADKRPALWGADKEGANLDPENPPINPPHLQPGPVGGNDVVNKEDLRVSPEGSGNKKRWYVVDKDGGRVPQFDPAGYTNEADAWAAIFPATGVITPPVNTTPAT